MECLATETVESPEVIGTITVGGTTYTKYRKVVDCGAMPNNTTKGVNHGITGLNTVLAMSMVAKNSNGDQIVIPYVTTVVTTSVYVSTTQIKITTNADLSMYTQTYATIEYY